MSLKIKNDDSFLQVPFKKGPDVIKTDWKSHGWGRREQTRIKVSPTGNLYTQTITQGCFKRFINGIFYYLTCGIIKSIGKYVSEHRTLGHLNAIKVNFDLSRKQKAFLVARQQANLGTSFVSLQSKVTKELKELCDLQTQYTNKMLAYKELREIIDHLTKMEEELASEVSSLGEPQERYDRLCIFEAQLHFFVKSKEEKLKQWQSSLGKANIIDIESQKLELQHQVDELHEKLTHHLSLLMQKREECHLFPKLYRQLCEMIVKTTETQTHSAKKWDKESLAEFKKEIDGLFRNNNQILAEIDRKKSFFESEAEMFRQKTFDDQIKGGKRLLIGHIDKLLDAAERFIPNSKPELEIRQMIEQNRLTLKEEPPHKENQVNDFLKLISAIIQKDNSALKNILEFYSLPVFSPRKNNLSLPNRTLSSLWLMEDSSGLSMKQREASRSFENVLEDSRHLITTMKAHSHEARQRGYLALEKELRDMIIRFSQKNKEFKKFAQNHSSPQELHLKGAEIHTELNIFLKQLAEIHQLIIQEETLERLGADVSTKVHQFARRLPGEILSDEDVAKTQEKIRQLIESDKSTLTVSKDNLATILQRQRQLITLCYSVAEKYIKMKNDILAKELHLSVDDSKVQFLHKARDTAWKSLSQQGPSCITPNDLTQWTQKVYAQGSLDETLIEVLKKQLGGTLDEVKDLIFQLGKEGKRELPTPKQTDISQPEYEKFMQGFSDLEGEKTLSLFKMKKLLEEADEKIQTWNKQDLISQDTSVRWNYTSQSLQAKNACIDLLLDYETSTIAQYVAHLEQQRTHHLQPKSSPFILTMFQTLFDRIKPFAKWNDDAPIRSLDSHHALGTKTLEEVQKEFHLLQSVDEAEKAYFKAFQEAQQFIIRCNQNNQFINGQKIQILLNAQHQQLNVANVNASNMLEYDKTLNLAREKLEDEIDLMQDMPAIEQLVFLPEESSQAQTLRQIVSQSLIKKVQDHQDTLITAKNDLKTLWEPVKSSWQQQLFDQIEMKRQTIGNFLKQLSIPSNTCLQVKELQSQIQQAIRADMQELENNVFLNKIVSTQQRYAPFISDIEAKIADFRRDFQFSHAHRLNRILQKEKGNCETLKKDLTSSAKMQAYAVAMETAMDNMDNVLKHIHQTGPISDLEQMKNLKSKNSEDFHLLHQHFRQGVESKLQDFHQKLNDYQKQTSAAIATIQCEININQQRKLRDATLMDKLLNQSKTRTELEVFQAKILEKNTILQKLQEKFPVWTYAVWMGKHPLDVSLLTPDQLKEYETEVNEFIEHCQTDLSPLIDLLKKVE